MKKIIAGVRKQIQIPFETLNMIDQLAQKRKISQADMIRLLLKKATVDAFLIPDCATPYISSRKRRKPQTQDKVKAVYDPARDGFPQLGKYQETYGDNQFKEYDRDCAAYARFYK